MQDEIWNQFGIQNYNGNVLSVYSVVEIITRTADSHMLVITNMDAVRTSARNLLALQGVKSFENQVIEFI